MNNWKVGFSRKARKFIDKNHLTENEIVDSVLPALHKLCGENINADVIKLKPPHQRYHRVRVGRMRITMEINFEKRIAEIIILEWRNSNSYK